MRSFKGDLAATVFEYAVDQSAIDKSLVISNDILVLDGRVGDYIHSKYPRSDSRPARRSTKFRVSDLMGE